MLFGMHTNASLSCFLPEIHIPVPHELKKWLVWKRVKGEPTIRMEGKEGLCLWPSPESGDCENCTLTRELHISAASSLLSVFFRLSLVRAVNWKFFTDGSASGPLRHYLEGANRPSSASKENMCIYYHWEPANETPSTLQSLSRQNPLYFPSQLWQVSH